MQNTEPSDELVYALWDRLADAPSERIDEALDHLLRELCCIFGADDACWSGVVRLAADLSDSLGGWRPGAFHPLRVDGPLARGFAHGSTRLLRKVSACDPSTLRHIALAGVFRANRLCDLVSAAWFKSDFYQTIYVRHGIVDAVYVSVPVSEDGESYYVLTRSSAHPPFSVRERDAIGRALRGLRWFHRRVMLSRGLLLATAPLTGAERKVLEGVLAGKADKEIATSLGRSVHTTREHVASIFRKFGVGSRTALMALWLGRSDVQATAPSI